MIDVHTHILPGMDDGSKDVQMSVQMLRMQQQQGIGTVIFTPHFYATENSPDQFLRRRQQAWDRLTAAWQEPTPHLLMGAEVQYFEGICQCEDLTKLCIQGTDLLLLEMPFFRWTERMVRDVLQIQEQFPIRILLAHLDRYESLYTKTMLQTLLQAGVLVQMNCSALEGFFSRRKVLTMLHKGQVHLFASDCHNLTSRAPCMGKWKKYIGKLEAEDLFPVESN